MEYTKIVLALPVTDYPPSPMDSCWHCRSQNIPPDPISSCWHCRSQNIGHNFKEVTVAHLQVSLESPRHTQLAPKIVAEKQDLALSNINIVGVQNLI